MSQQADPGKDIYEFCLRRFSQVTGWLSNLRIKPNSVHPSAEQPVPEIKVPSVSPSEISEIKQFYQEDDGKVHYCDELLKLDGDIRVSHLPLKVNCAEVTVLTTVDRLLQATSKYDPRFTFSLMPSGSFYQDLKIGSPDEFDFLLCLDNLSMCEVQKIPEYHISTDGILCLLVKEVPASWHKSDEEKFINKMFGTNMLCGDAINQEIVDLWTFKLKHVLPHRANFNTVSLELHDSTIQVKLRWSGYDNVYHYIKVSMTIAVRSHSQMFGDFCSDLSTLNPAIHPFGKMVEIIRQSPVVLTPASAWAWRVSNHYCEKVVLRYLDAISPNVKACLRVLKSLRDLSLRDEIDGVHIVDTITLKTLLFWEAEEFYNANYWSPQNLPDRIINVLKRLKAAVDRHFLPDYFVETVNTLPAELLLELPLYQKFQETVKLRVNALIDTMSQRNDEDPIYISCR
ncbi:cyclic GMP-AMP synthase-like receptor [Lineus longissimus]|uniref:cyclic GMP-AMP synthase-like receptor n=1 Tax=Lineus longissimus TaxID=88925 RepID=UPI002B4CD3E6